MSKPHVLIVEARFYDDLADQLFEGAKAELDAAGITFDRVNVPGSFEIPGAIAMSNASVNKDYDGYLALGCVIRGETSHYDHICDSLAVALQDLACNKLLPIGFGVLTCESREQATIRADKSQKDYGGKAAKALSRMIEMKKNI